MESSQQLKPPLTIEEQINLLESRGLIIDDRDEAIKFLTDNNYYRLNIYFHKSMESQDHFYEGITLRKIINLYENDRWLRNNILAVLEPLEIRLKTVIAYYLGCKYGSDAFYNENICENKKYYNEIFKYFQQEIDRNKKDSVIKHHNHKYGGKFPIWVVVEYFSFHTISKYYKNLLSIDKKNISENTFNLSGYYLGQWTQSLSIMRNICAHYGYLFRRTFSIAIDGGSIFDWNEQENRTLFSILQVTRRLSSPAVWNPFINLIIERAVQRDSFVLKDYGFPANWLECLGPIGEE